MEEDRDRIRKMDLGRQNGEPQPSFYEFTVKREDGELRRVEASVSFIEYMGSPANLAFIRDITERKLMEELLLNAERKASKKAETMLGHDIRVVLQNIRRALRQAEECPSTTDQTLAKIKESIDYAVHMIEDLQNDASEAPSSIGLKF